MLIINSPKATSTGTDIGLTMPATTALPGNGVLDFIHGRKKTKKVRVKVEADKKPAKGKRGAKAAKAKEAKAAEPAQTVVEDFGLFRNPPRALKTEITRYLREREADAEWFDSTVLVARKAVKRLYALLHVKPGERAQKILFDEAPPADSRLFALRELSQAGTPTEQARAILEHQIPYRVAATVVRQMTPTILLALIERMSPQELINNLGSLQRRGAMDNPDLKALIEQKLEAAKTGTRVSAFKAEEAMKAVNVSADVRKKLEEVADTQIKAKGRITRPTALLIDKSSSMELAIELGKRIGAMISAICEKELYVYAFDSMAYPIERASDDLASWEKALRGINAGGSTSCGAAIDYLTRKRQYVEQIIVVTDEEENTAPLFVDALKKYREALPADPNVCFVRTPGGTTWRPSAARPGLVAMRFSSRGITTRCRTSFRSCRVPRSWNCSWKSWNTRCPRGSPRRHGWRVGRALQARAWELVPLRHIPLMRIDTLQASGTCVRRSSSWLSRVIR